MKAVWKFPLLIEALQVVEIPVDSAILCVQVQDDIPCLWVLVDPDVRARTKAVIEIWGTGHLHETVPDNYLGTFQLRGGALVFHVFIHEPPTKTEVRGMKLNG